MKKIKRIFILSVFCALTLLSRSQGFTALDPIVSVEIGDRGEFIVNGEPFIPIMSWLQHPDNSWNSFDNLRSLNFNTFMGTQGSITPLEHAEAAQAAGGYAVVKQHQANEVAEAAGHDYILAWHQPDEPDMPTSTGGGEYGPKKTPEEMAANYDFLQSQNVNRPVFVTFTAHYMEEFRSRYTAQQQAEIYPPFVESADVLGFDVYPIYGWGRPNWLNFPASGVTQLIDIADGKPVYAWIETSKGSQWITYDRQPDVLPEHTRFQVWSALINGATAIGYFTHAWEPAFTEFAPTPEMQDELERLNGQITRLTREILAPLSEREITIQIVSQSDSEILTNRFLSTENDEALYIFAQNSDLGPNADQLGQFDPISPRAGTAEIQIEGLKNGAVIEIVDENQEVIASAGAFTDEIGPLRERIYRIDQSYLEPVGSNAIESDNNAPYKLVLNQNYPNPFNLTTTINFTLPAPDKVSLIVYDILGREIVMLVNETKPAGKYSVEWDGQNSLGVAVNSGIYFYQLKTNGGYTKTKRMLLNRQ